MSPFHVAAPLPASEFCGQYTLVRTNRALSASWAYSPTSVAAYSMSSPLASGPVNSLWTYPAGSGSRASLTSVPMVMANHSCPSLSMPQSLSSQ